MKKLRITLIVFALVLTMSVVYAISDGSFDFNFSGTLSNLSVEAEETEDPICLKGATGTWTSTTSGADIEDVDLPVDGAKITFTFKIANNSEKTIEIGTITHTNTSPYIIIGGDYEDLINTTIDAGDESSPYTISIERNYDGTTEELFSFVLTIEYNIVTTP